MIAGESIATALALTVAVAAAQAPAPQFDLTKVTDHVFSFVEALDFDRIVPARGPASAPKAEVTAIREYLEDPTRAVSAATEKTGNQFAFDQITELVKADLRPKYGQWGEFDNWMMMNVDRILLEQRSAIRSVTHQPPAASLPLLRLARKG
jgi:hypothetical protein